MTILRNLSRFALVLLLCLCAASQNKPDYRHGFGEPRATIMESLLKEILPNAQFRWDPQLVVDAGDGVARIQFPGFAFRPASDGNIDGATGFEVGSAKQDFVFASKNFKPTNGSSFATELIVFRATPDGRILTHRKFSLDPSDPVTEIKTIQVQTWPDAGWPTLAVQYVSYTKAPDSFATVEWRAVFDANSGKVTSRMPLGIRRVLRNGQEQVHMFSSSRSGPAQVQLTDVLSKQSAPYQCPEPCVVDRATLLDQWPQ